MEGKQLIRPLLRRYRKVARQRRKLAENEAKNARKEQKEALKRYKDKHADRIGAIFSDARWRDLFGDDKFLLIDVGAAGGLGKEGRSVTPLMRVIGFEPLNGGGFTMYDGAMTVLNAGLDSVAGTRELYLAGPMSSFLRPDLDVWDQFGFRPGTPLERRTVTTTTLDDVVRNQQLKFVDFIKLDTQGSELDILRGGVVTVGTMAIGMRIEVSFLRHYKAQPLFADIDPYVRAQGFDLVDLTRFNRKQHARIGDVDKAAVAKGDGQLLQADALYFRTPARLVQHLGLLEAQDRIRYIAGVLVTCLTYNKLDLAARYIHEAGSLIEPSSSTLMLELLRCANDARGVELQNR